MAGKKPIKTYGPILARAEIEGLKSWYRSTPRRPLLLRGPRQVGKTSLVRHFAKEFKLQLIEVNLELQKKIRATFSHMEPSKIMKDIQNELNVEMNKKTILFIDEIQTVPEAIQALRYFYELMPELPVVAAGSLLEFVLSDHSFSMPVGRIEMFYLGPMKFSDFLRAIKKEKLHKAIVQFKLEEGLTILEHQDLLSHYLEYLQVGGMPDAINEYVRTESLAKVRKIQKNILQTYSDDFAKYAKRIPLERIEKVFKFASANIGRKVKYTEIDPSEQAKSLLLAIELLEKAGIIYRVFHSDASGIPLELSKQNKIFKFLFMDIGLVSASLNLDGEEIKKIYFNPPNDLLLLHRGLISEQFVGQSLLFSSTEEKRGVYYWLRDQSAYKAEVDYLIARGLDIIPIEVKAGKTGNKKSLFEFAKSHHSRVALKLGTKEFSVKNYDLQENGKKLKIFEIPLFLAERLWTLKF